MQIKINSVAIAKARRQLAYDLEGNLSEAVEVSKILAPVDTSSLQESIAGAIFIQNDLIKLRIKAGGEDYRGQLLSTGQTGNLVDYAAEQEAIHGFLEAGLARLLANL